MTFDDLSRVLEYGEHKVGIHQVIDPMAIEVLKRKNMKLIVFNGFKPENLLLAAEGKNPLQIDSKAPSISVADYAYNETRYRMLLQQDEERAEELMKGAEADAKRRWSLYTQMAEMDYSQMSATTDGVPPVQPTVDPAKSGETKPTAPKPAEIAEGEAGAMACTPTAEGFAESANSDPTSDPAAINCDPPTPNEAALEADKELKSEDHTASSMKE